MTEVHTQRFTTFNYICCTVLCHNLSVACPMRPSIRIKNGTMLQSLKKIMVNTGKFQKNKAFSGFPQSSFYHHSSVRIISGEK